jgi:hypothetical protein
VCEEGGSDRAREHGSRSRGRDATARSLGGHQRNRNRFAFAITDYYGYDDIPYTHKFFTYERNVDPATGHPRIANSRGSCDDLDGDGIGDGDDCLQPVPLGTTDASALEDGNALEFHHANQHVFAMLCAATFGSIPTDAAACSVNALSTGVTLNLLNGFLVGGPGDSVPLEVNDPQDGGGGPLSSVLTDQQEALLGCGPFYGTDCDTDGFDLLNLEASVLFQSFMGFEGSPITGGNTSVGLQPGTFRILGPGQAERFDGGSVCTRFEAGRSWVLPGCRSPLDESTTGWDPLVDSGQSIYDAFRFGDPTRTTLLHPFTGDPFQSEMAVLSWNFQVALVTLGALGGIEGCTTDDGSLNVQEPQFCGAVQGLTRFTGVRRNDLRAGGNGRFGRRDFQWHAGTPLALGYQKNNVLGFAVDFAETFTETSWGIEATWVKDFLTNDADSVSGLTEVDQYNLTISVDRPTFINFLTPGRNFIFNAQLFVGYIDGYRQSFPSNGPYTFLSTLSVQTGYHQDRLNPTGTFVYDWESNSGSFLPSIQYRFSESFSVTFGGAFFFGRTQRKKMPINPESVQNEVGSLAYQTEVENGLAAVRDLDHFFLRIRYTF